MKNIHSVGATSALLTIRLTVDLPAAAPPMGKKTSASRVGSARDDP